MRNGAVTAFIYLILLFFSSSSFVFFFSFAYESGFYSALGSSIGEWPVSIADMMLGCVKWIPHMLPFFLSGAVIYIFLMRKEEKNKEDNKGPAISQREGSFLCKGILFISLVYLIAYILFGSFFKTILINMAITSIVPVIALFGPQKLSNQYRRYILVVTYALLLCSQLYFYGYDQAKGLCTNHKNEMIISMDGQENIKRNVICTLDKGILVFANDPSKIEFISHSNIVSIIKVVNPQKKEDFKGFYSNIKNVFSTLWINKKSTIIPEGS